MFCSFIYQGRKKKQVSTQSRLYFCHHEYHPSASHIKKIIQVHGRLQSWSSNSHNWQHATISTYFLNMKVYRLREGTYRKSCSFQTASQYIFSFPKCLLLHIIINYYVLFGSLFLQKFIFSVHRIQFILSVSLRGRSSFLEVCWGLQSSDQDHSDGAAFPSADLSKWTLVRSKVVAFS